MAQLVYIPDEDVKVHEEGAIRLICKAFQSHENGLPEWLKNAADEYIREDAPEAKRIILGPGVERRRGGALASAPRSASSHPVYAGYWQVLRENAACASLNDVTPASDFSLMARPAKPTAHSRPACGYNFVLKAVSIPA